MHDSFLLSTLWEHHNIFIKKGVGFMVKKYAIFIIALFSLLLISFFCKTVYTEYNLKRITQTQIQENEFTSNKKTLVYLKRINKPKIDIVSDNQGSGNTLYYVEKINDNYFDVTYIKSNGKIKLKSIFIQKKQ